MRKCGVLLPVFSLPSRYGAGCMGAEAYKFIDSLADAGQSYWQILPMSPVGKAYSPYSPRSTFGMEAMFIDLETLHSQGLLSDDDMAAALECPDDCDTAIDYGRLAYSRKRILKIAYDNYTDGGNVEAFRSYCSENADWLDDLALYLSLREKHGGRPWNEWPEGIKRRMRSELESAHKSLACEVNLHKWLQYIADTQWQSLRAYAHSRGVEIIGDTPIYTSYDSADCWSHPELFNLGNDLTPYEVSGCPPDDFNDEGQVWENPLYEWSRNRKTGYAWWISRMKRCFELYDIVRIDHARGFCSYYSIPASTGRAADGRWIKGPGLEFLDTLNSALGKNGRLIAEDLGHITRAVRKMLDAAGYPGMSVLQFAFDDKESNPYLPKNARRNSVMYTGTHDNDTLIGWYESAAGSTKESVNRYLVDAGYGLLKTGEKYAPSSSVSSALIREALLSSCDTCIIPMQDYLMLGSEARINTPGTTEGNWSWRMSTGAFDRKTSGLMLRLARESGRSGK